MRRPPTIVVQLVHLAGPRKREIQEFTKDIIHIGKYSSSEVCFPPDAPEVAAVSRAHAEIVREGNQFKLIDRSTNGTLVNGNRVTETYLKSGDILEFSEGGPKVSFLTQMTEVPDEPVISSSPPHLNVKEDPPAELQGPPPRKPPQARPDYAPESPPLVAVDVVKASLTIQYGATIRSYTELPLTIGKSPMCKCIIDHPAVYDQHAQIFFSQDQYWIKDLTGQKLVKLNGQPISSQATLSIEDNVAFGPKGPFFKYVGEGRFAEALQPPAEEPSLDKQEAETVQSKDKPSKGVVPRLKKLFTN